MKVVDITTEHEVPYLQCLEDWSEEMTEAGPRKGFWYGKMKEKGLRVKLALDDNGVIGGMIQYVPVEHSFVHGDSLYFVHCIWVHGYDQGRGDFQGKGMGTALLRAAEEDARVRGAKGMAVWGISLPFWMRASWFKKHGYVRVDKVGIQVLLWKPFTRDARPPRWIAEKKRPGNVPGKVTVASFVNGWCPAQNLVHERAKRAAKEFGDEVAFLEFDTSDRDVFENWGVAGGLFIDGKAVRTGPPPTYDKIRRLIERKVRKLA